MGKRSYKKRRPGELSQPWDKLTWDDLNEWAGVRSAERGRSYQPRGAVRELCLTADGALLAWVSGTQRYATRVELNGSRRKRSERIASACSCPVGLACKHAIATILEYLSAIEAGADTPLADDSDPRLSIIEGVDKPTPGMAKSLYTVTIKRDGGEETTHGVEIADDVPMGDRTIEFNL